MTRLLRLMRAAAFAPAFACTSESAPPADSATTGDTAAVVVHADSIRAPSAAAMTVTPRGVGALQAGMTIAEARAAVGSKLVVPAGTDTTACGWLQWVDGPQGVAVMIDSGRVARIDVREGAMATSEGARIGDTEERVNTLYAGRVATTPHKYTDGHYLTVTPSAPGERDFRIVFETEKGKVTRYRAGRLPSVAWVEGCS